MRIPITRGLSINDLNQVWITTFAAYYSHWNNAKNAILVADKAVDELMALSEQAKNRAEEV